MSDLGAVLSTAIDVLVTLTSFTFIALGVCKYGTRSANSKEIFQVTVLGLFFQPVLYAPVIIWGFRLLVSSAVYLAARLPGNGYMSSSFQYQGGLQISGIGYAALMFDVVALAVAGMSRRRAVARRTLDV